MYIKNIFSRISSYLLIIILFFSLNINGQDSALSIHLSGGDNSVGDIIMKTLKVPHKTIYTYYCALSFNGGYCGMQNHPTGNNFIFSLWDPPAGSGAITAPFIGTGTEVSRFGGEGTGLKSINFGVGWAEGYDYQMVARTWDVDNHTFYGYWVHDIYSNNWMHLVTMDYPVSDVRFDGPTGSFLEDWSSSGQNMRKVYQKDGYKRKENKSWHPFNSASFSINTYDIPLGRRSYNYRDNYDAGVEDGYYFMQSGGTTTPSFSGTGTSLTNDFPAEPVSTPIEFYFTEVSDSVVSWTVPQSSTPQFKVKIEMSAETVVDTVATELTTYDISDQTGSLVFVTIEDILGNETRKMISISSSELAPKTPANLGVDEFASSSFTVSWDEVTNAIEYELEIQKNSLWESAGFTQANTFTFTNLEGRTRYRARVSAKNDFGQSAFTEYVWSLTGVQNETMVPNANWSLFYVDSEETAGEDGAASNAIDGDESSMWHTEWSQQTPTHPHEIQIDLGANYSITGFKYLPRQDGGENGTIADYEFYVSQDGTDWSDPIASGTFESTMTLKEIDFDVVDASYVRFVALSEIHGGVWSSMAELSLVGSLVSEITQEDSSIPFDYKLHDAYPNPFNPVTNIAYSLPKETKVKIAVYDLLGREVAKLVDEVVGAGEHNITWNAVDFASGTYFYTIEAEKFCNTKKIILLK